MKYLGLVLIPLLAVLSFAGPGCQQAQDEPKVQMEQVLDEPAEVPTMEKAPVAIEEAEVEVEVEEEVDVEVEVDVNPEKEGSGLLKQLQERGEEEIEKQAEEHEVEKKIDELGM